MDSMSLFCLVAASLAGCSAIGGAIAYHKRRSPTEGMLLGLLLGPIGVAIECQYPYARRPMVDENAWNSLRSMMEFQETGGESKRMRENPPR